MVLFGMGAPRGAGGRVRLPHQGHRAPVPAARADDRRAPAAAEDLGGRGARARRLGSGGAHRRPGGQPPVAADLRAAGAPARVGGAGTAGREPRHRGRRAWCPPGRRAIEVVDRPAWVAANVAAFRRLLAPAAGTLAGQGRPPAGHGCHPHEPGRRRGAGHAPRVDEQPRARAVRPAPGGSRRQRRARGCRDLVYLVGPNLVGLERRFGFPPGQFRLWVPLHELTHRAQFTGVPWLAPHYLGLVEQALTHGRPRQRAAGGRRRAR